MSEILGIARFTFHPGRAEDFKRLSAKCMEIVRAKDTGTLQYDIYIDADETGAVVIERYRDSDAVIEHHEHLGDEIFAEMMTLGTVEGETLGHASEKHLAMMEGTPVRFYLPFRSL